MKKQYLLLFLIMFSITSFATIRRVSTDGLSTNNGSSWSTTMDLQSAIDASTIGDEIWVKAGTYNPTKNTHVTQDPNIYKAFVLKAGIKIYGGFSGTESTVASRNSNDHTVLSGKHSNTSYSLHVVYANTNGSTDNDKIVLDNLHITEGQNNSSNISDHTVQGAAVWLKGVLELNNISVYNCRTNIGGIYLEGANSKLTINNSLFYNNTTNGGTGSRGTCIYAIGTVSVDIKNSIFRDNRKTNPSSNLAGAIFATSNADYNSLLLNITNCEFSNNECNTAGGALRLEQTVKANIKNSLFKQNNVFPSIGANTYNSLDYTNTTDKYITSGGGAILFTGSTTGNKTNGHIKVSDCTFENNSSTSRGAALYISGANNSESYITRNKFISNTAGISGAALEYVQSNKNPGALAVNSHDLIITDNIFYDNKSVYYGGAISITAACPIILANNTFFKNAITGSIVTSISQAPKREIGGGAAIHFASSGAYQGDLRKVIANCIFSENTAPTASDYVNIAPGETSATGSYTKNTIFINGNGFTPDTDASVKKPDNSTYTADIFKSTNPLSSHFLRLDNTNINNPAINSGLNTISKILPASTNLVFTVDSLDLAGQSRILSTTIDMGAYEAHPLSVEVLPVVLLSVEIQKTKQNTALLTWKVSSEKNNSKFIIERSGDGVNYTLIGSKLSNGDTNAVTSYNLTDNTPINGVSYYRLSQIDNDGTNKVLAIKSFNYSALSNDISIYPIPAKEFLTIKLINKSATKTVVDLFSISGKKILTQTFDNEQDTQINLSNVPNGVYVVIIKSGILLEKRVITVSK